MQYAKIENGLLIYAPLKLTDYTDYKPVSTSPAPTRYHQQGADEADDEIIITWSLPNLVTLKALLKDEAEAIKSKALVATELVSVDDVGDVVYDQQAALNIVALYIDATDDSLDAYILADDTATMLNKAQIGAIKDAFKAHVNGIYLTKIAAFAAIDAAETVEELLTINQQ